MRKVEVKPYDPNWQNLYKQEAERFRILFGDELVEIHHIGSTSVYGLSAKPVIDLMPVVADIEKVDSFNDQMKALGYEARGEFGIEGRRYFQKGGEKRTHHVHLFQQHNPHIIRHVAFRDYLRAHSKDRERYGRLKELLAKQYPYNMDAYIRGKHDLVTTIEQKALNWART